MHQDLGLIDSLNSVENLALGRGFHTTRFGRVRWAHELRSARRDLAALGAHFDPRRPVGELTPAERALVALARSLEGWGDEGGVLILDEPTAPMTQPEVAVLFDAVRTLTARRAAVLFVSHRLDEVFEIADDYTVLRDGKVVATGEVADLDRERPDRDDHRSRSTSIDHAGHEVHGAPALQVRSLWGARLERFDLDVRPGEIVGVAGLLGSGREELAMLLVGAVERGSWFRPRRRRRRAGRPAPGDDAGDRHRAGRAQAVRLDREAVRVAERHARPSAAALPRRPALA